MRKLCLPTKFPHQEIRWNYGILRSSMSQENAKNDLVKPFCANVPIYFNAFQYSVAKKFHFLVFL